MRLDVGDLDAFREFEPAMRSTDQLPARAQRFYREWDALERLDMPPIHRPTRNKSSGGEPLIDLVHPIEPRDVPQRIKRNAKRFEALMVIIFHEVASRLLPDAPIDE